MKNKTVAKLALGTGGALAAGAAGAYARRKYERKQKQELKQELPFAEDEFYKFVLEAIRSDPDQFRSAIRNVNKINKKFAYTASNGKVIARTMSDEEMLRLRKLAGVLLVLYRKLDDKEKEILSLKTNKSLRPGISTNKALRQNILDENQLLRKEIKKLRERLAKLNQSSKPQDSGSLFSKLFASQ